MTRVADELDMTAGEVRHALFAPSLPADGSLLDQAIGPSVLRVSTPLDVPPAQAFSRALKLLRRHRLSPAGGVWLQDKSQWPDPLAETAVTKVSVWVDRSSVQIVADVETTRRGYWMGAVSGLGLIPLAVLAAGPVLGFAGGAAAAGAVIALVVRDYRNRTSLIERNLAAFAASTAQPVMPPSVIG